MVQERDDKECTQEPVASRTTNMIHDVAGQTFDILDVAFNGGLVLVVGL